MLNKNADEDVCMEVATVTIDAENVWIFPLLALCKTYANEENDVHD